MDRRLNMAASGPTAFGAYTAKAVRRKVLDLTPTRRPHALSRGWALSGTAVFYAFADEPPGTMRIV